MDMIIPPGLTTTPSKSLTGNALKLHDAEMQLINSGPSGMKRLAAMRAIDLQEQMPGLSDSDAKKMGSGYVMLKVLGVNGLLTQTTQAEVLRLERK